MTLLQTGETKGLFEKGLTNEKLLSICFFLFKQNAPQDSSTDRLLMQKVVYYSAKHGFVMSRQINHFPNNKFQTVPN